MLTVFFIFAAISFSSSLGRLFAMLFSVLIVPIKPLQTLIAQIFKSRKTKAIILIVLFLLTVSFSTTPSDIIDPPIKTESLVEVSGQRLLKSTVKTSVEKEGTLEEIPLPLEASSSEKTEVVNPSPELLTEPVSESKEPKFEIHFLDVGQADAILVLCDDHAMLVDGGDVDDSSFIYTYLKENGIEHLDVIVCTHAHSDHAGGLSGALNYSTVGTAYAPTAESENVAFNNFIEYLNKQNVMLTIPAAGDTFCLGSANVAVLGPINPSDNLNNSSIVLRIEFGDTSFLLTGDAETEEENDILNAGYNLESTVLKVGHHGSSTSSGPYFIAAVNPEYAVISDGLDASGFGRLTERTLEKLQASGAEIYRTDIHGNIICISDGINVSFSVEKTSEPKEIIPLLTDSLTTDATETSVVRSIELPEPSIDSTMGIAPEAPSEPTPEPAPTGRNYILNTNSKKFHYPSCSSADDIKASNKLEFFGTRDELRNMDYEPCGRCKP